MAPSKNTDREVRAARDRLRRYNARQTVNETRTKRRRRDNILAISGLVIVATIATIAQVLYFSAGPGIPEPTATPSSSPTQTAEPQANVGAIPSPDIAEARLWTGSLSINDIALSISLDGAAAPQAVASVVTDANNGYYSGKSCHRLVADDSLTALQCGSVSGDGSIDPSYSFGPIENAPADGVYPAGTIALANAGTAASQDHQFFIVLSDSRLDTTTGGYTVVGTITNGLDALVSQIADAGIVGGGTEGAPAIPSTITSFTIQ